MKKQDAIILCAHFHLEMNYLHQEMDTIKRSSEALQLKRLYQKPKDDLASATFNLRIVNDSVKLMKRLSQLCMHKSKLLLLINALPLDQDELEKTSKDFRKIITSNKADISMLRQHFLSYLEDAENYEMCSYFISNSFYALAA